MHGEWFLALGRNRGDPGPDARVKFPKGPQASSASPGPAPLTRDTGSSDLPPARGARAPEPHTALRKDLGDCCLDGSTAL